MLRTSGAGASTITSSCATSYRSRATRNGRAARGTARPAEGTPACQSHCDCPAMEDPSGRWRDSPPGQLCRRMSCADVSPARVGGSGADFNREPELDETRHVGTNGPGAATDLLGQFGSAEASGACECKGIEESFVVG